MTATINDILARIHHHAEAAAKFASDADKYPAIGDSRNAIAVTMANMHANVVRAMHDLYMVAKAEER